MKRTADAQGIRDTMAIMESIGRQTEADDQVAWYIQKFKDKMSGSNLEATIGWIDGIGKLSDEEKVAVLRGIAGEYETNNGSYGRSNMAKLVARYKWFNPKMMEDRQISEAMIKVDDRVIELVQKNGGGFGLANHEVFNGSFYLDNGAGTNYAAFARAAQDGFLSGSRAAGLTAMDAMVYLNAKAGRWLGDEITGLDRSTPKVFGQAVTDLVAKRAKRDMMSIAKDSPLDWSTWRKLAGASEREAAEAPAKWTKGTTAVKFDEKAAKQRIEDAIVRALNDGDMAIGAKLFAKRPAERDAIGIVVTLENGELVRIKTSVSMK